MFENFKNTIRTQILPTSAHWATLHDNLRSRLQCFKAERTPEAQEPLNEHFAEVVRAWGVESVEQIPLVIRDLRLRLLLFASPVLGGLCAAFFTQRPAVWLTVALVTFPCLLGIFTTCWRISVLTQRHFQSFTRWLLSIISFTQKGA